MSVLLNLFCVWIVLLVYFLYVWSKKERKEKRVEAGQGGRADNDKGAEKDAVHQVV